MDSPNFAPPHSDASRPSLGFPLGTALLLLLIFTLSGVFSCCYHWDKLRSLRRRTSQPDLPLPSKSNSLPPDLEMNPKESLSVLMPGDSIPKFIAMPCPKQPPRPEIVQIEIQKSPKPPPRIAVPFY